MAQNESGYLIADAQNLFLFHNGGLKELKLPSSNKEHLLAQFEAPEEVIFLNSETIAKLIPDRPEFISSEVTWKDVALNSNTILYIREDWYSNDRVKNEINLVKTASGNYTDVNDIYREIFYSHVQKNSELAYLFEGEADGSLISEKLLMAVLDFEVKSFTDMYPAGRDRDLLQSIDTLLTLNGRLIFDITVKDTTIIEVPYRVSESLDQTYSISEDVQTSFFDTMINNFQYFIKKIYGSNYIVFTSYDHMLKRLVRHCFEQQLFALETYQLSYSDSIHEQAVAELFSFNGIDHSQVTYELTRDTKFNAICVKAHLDNKGSSCCYYGTHLTELVEQADKELIVKYIQNNFAEISSSSEAVAGSSDEQRNHPALEFKFEEFNRFISDHFMLRIAKLPQLADIDVYIAGIGDFDD
ncbi:hypothetical protein [Paenibacillus sp. MMS20-IR301]|uniref:hypothetical protein n=1 Tax=Paenibacillus sp. MMS20-IR301 TaxID=2895946 RepID=UPI0028ED1C57|nr:hypothetical protein [Paenibacillus sp. MMS20-IR301]WNS43480.1 hypothetical protein LOS79_31850 [Paenibacillus sp. MMS20-IR301]